MSMSPRADLIVGLIDHDEADGVNVKGFVTQGAAAVTGAIRGIGATYAERLARRGRDLILFDGDLAALEHLAGRLSRLGVRIELVVADLARPDDLAAVETQLRGDDRIALLVNDADFLTVDGRSDSDTAGHELSRQEAAAAAARRLARAAAEGFVAQGYGTILNVAVANAQPTDAERPAADAALARWIEFGRTLRAELRPHGVHVKTRVHRPPISRSSSWPHAPFA